MLNISVDGLCSVYFWHKTADNPNSFIINTLEGCEMGIIGRLRSIVSTADTGRSKADTSEQDALRLICKGNLFEAESRFKEAMQLYMEAIRLAPNLARAHFNHGNALLAMGDIKGALDAYGKAIKLEPDYAEAHHKIGNAQSDNWQFDDAVASYRRALKINPDLFEAHYNLGVALPQIGQLEEAAASFRRALEIKPALFQAHHNLGVALTQLGQFESAFESFRRALEIKPDLFQAHHNLGVALKEFGQPEMAMASFRRSLEINPDYAEALCNLGVALNKLGQTEKAMACHRRALEIDPDLAEVHSNMLFVSNYTGGFSPSYYLEKARQYGRIIAGRARIRFSVWQCAVRPERLRVGLVSGDLRDHSVGHFLEALLAHIDPARIELIAYQTHHNKEDKLTARIRPYFSAWKILFGKSDEAAARLIHADGVHILFDLSCHTQHNCLPVFAWKPAPVQVTWLGLPSTTGVAEMDYVLGDPYAIPAEYENYFSETVWRMPESCLCLAVPASPVNVAPLPALSVGYVTFGSFNNLTKMNDAVVAVWARILKSVPDSKLLLKTNQLNNPVDCEQTRQRFASCGIASDRLLLGRTLASRDDHLAAYNKVDIALDPFPYPGVTTSFEALWMGVPVLSLQGDRFLSRTAGSIAHNAGLPDWVAADEDDYVAKAVVFSGNLERLAALRADLRQQVLASPLFDAPRFARNFEDALWGMWQSYQAKQEKST